ncbi:MAG: hypothetical protein IPK72_21140 [Candidatus Eisenbacteria bacterium]|nr:hypothetical protein [Candidatus Eisenbacteria bacterium]
MAEQNATRGLSGVHKSLVKVPAHAAATATEQWPVFFAPFPCIVTGCKIVPQAAATGDNTNTTNLNLVNKGAAGSGTTELANLDPVTGTNLTAFADSSLTVTGSLANRTLAEGDVLTLQHEKVGTGLAIAELLVEISYKAA